MARGGEAQRAHAVARHQGRSTSGVEKKIGVKYRGFICPFFFHTGGLSLINPGFLVGNQINIEG